MRVKYNERVYEVEGLGNIVIDGKKVESSEVILLIDKPTNYTLNVPEQCSSELYVGSVDFDMGGVEVHLLLKAYGRLYYEPETDYTPRECWFCCDDVVVDEAEVFYDGEEVKYELAFDENFFRADFEF